MAAANLYVRKSGSDNNGGSSGGAAPDRTGADGASTNNSATFTAASGAFTAADVDKLIFIVSKGRYRITAVTNSTTVTLSANISGTSSGLTWNLGGAVLTIGALLTNANVAVAGGDSIYIGAGTYRETVTVSLAPSSNVNVLADVDGAKTGDPGMVQWTAFTTNDKTAPAASNVLNLNGKSNFTFKNIFFVGGAATVIGAATATSQNINFTDCDILGDNSTNAVLMSVTGAAGGGTAFNWTVDRCRFWGMRSGSLTVSVAQAASGSGSNDVNFLVQNCLFVSHNASGAVQLSGATSTGARPGGFGMRNCLSITAGSLLNISTDAWASAGTVSSVANCAAMCGAAVALIATTSGQVNEDYNLLITSNATKRTLVTAGTHSVTTGYALLFHFGQERCWGGFTRLFGEPLAASPLLGFGNDGNQTSYDETNRPRPAGGASASPAVGFLERSNTFAREITTVHTGANAISATGPAYQEFLVPVDATQTTISVYLRYDSTYAGTRPQLQIDANGEIGVAAETVTVSAGGLNGWAQVSLSAFTPTATGVVCVRVISNDTNGGGKCYADSFAVT